MAHRGRVTVESSSSSDSDSDSKFPSASSHRTSPTSPVEKSAPSSRKQKRESSDNDNDNKAKCSKLPRSHKNLNEEPRHPEHTQNPGEIHLSKVQQVIITTIRAAGLTLGLQRIPAGFHVVFKVDGAEYQTSNKSVHVNQVFVEWHERILLPCDPSSKVRVSMYASFELGPMMSREIHLGDIKE